jgi:hypothetical protein
MSESPIDRKLAKGFLLVLLPAALFVSFLFVAWPLILGAVAIIVAVSGVQSYQWSKTVREIDPIFQGIIAQNRGEIAPIDLADRAKVSGKVAQRYLAIKADEFGTTSRQHPERGPVYYFISVSTLGTILDDSEMKIPTPLPPSSSRVMYAPAPNPPVVVRNTTERVETQPAPTLQSIAIPLETPTRTEIEPVPTTESIIAPVEIAPAEPVAASIATPEIAAPIPPATTIVAPTEIPTEPLAELPVETPAPTATAHLQKILKSDLAKRLEVQPSTLYKRRNDADFTEWSQSRDPEGIGWGFLSETKEFYKIEND